MKKLVRLFDSIAGAVVLTAVLGLFIGAIVFALDLLRALGDGDCVGGRHGDLWICDSEPSTSWFLYIGEHPRWIAGLGILVVLVLSTLLFKEGKFKFRSLWAK